MLRAWSFGVVVAAMACAVPTAVAFSEATGSIGVGAGVGYRIVATADWNNDQKIDWLTTDTTGGGPGSTTVKVRTWSSDASAFQGGPNYTFPVGSSPILYVAAADFNRDGRIDTLVTLADGSVYLIPQDLRGEFGVARRVGDGVYAPGSVNVLGYDARCAIPQVYAVRHDGSAELLSFPKLVSGDCGATGDFTIETRVVAPAKMLGDAAAPDLNGDCVADTIVASVDGTGGKVLSVLERPAVAGGNITEDLAVRFSRMSPAGAFGRVAFADWTGNGAADFLTPVCLDAAGRPSATACPAATFNALVMVPNKVPGSACPGDNCCSSHEWGFSDITDTDVVAALPALKLVNLSTCGGVHGKTIALSAHVVLRAGDYDDDGRLDAVVASSLGPLVLRGEGSGSMSCNLLTNLIGGNRPLLSNRSADPFFFDINDDGRLDVVTTNTAISDANAERGSVFAFYGNAAELGNYYLTAVTINGAEIGGATAWGAAIIGATHRFQFTDINQNVHTATATQAISSAASALQPARSHFGLAITFSYIVNYATGYGVGTGALTHSWPVYLMPNSQMVVIASPTVSPADWTLKLFLFGQAFMRLVLYAWLTSLGVIGIPLAVLKVREIQQDRRDLHRNE